MNYKKIMSKILLMVIVGTLVFPEVTKAIEINSQEISQNEIVDPYEDAYFHMITKEQLLLFSYENKEVEESMAALIDRTENLKVNYSVNEVFSILKELQSNIKNITKSDYENEYTMIHDDNNYETGEVYKYKVSPTVWIVKNILHSYSIQEVKDFKEFKNIIDLIYDMALTEIKNGSMDDKLMQIIVNLNDLNNRFPDEYSDYISFVSGLATKDSLDYENGKMPEEKIPSKVYIENQKENEKEKITNGELVEIDNTIEKEKVDEEYLENTNTISISNQNTLDIYNNDGMDAYKDNMNTIEKDGYKEVKEYTIKTIYYTLDKSIENIEWEVTGVDMDTNGEVSYEKFVHMLKSISDKIEDASIIEDEDMVMLIAEGKPLVLNKVEKVNEEDINTLFEQFEKLGIKVGLKQDEIEDNNISLSDKLEAGDINEIVIDGNKLILIYKPILVKGIVQLPIEQVAEQIGYEVIQSKDTITLNYKAGEDSSCKIELTIGSKNIIVNGQKMVLKTEVTKKDDIVYAEFDKIAKEAGYTYSYNAKSGYLELKK